MNIVVESRRGDWTIGRWLCVFVLDITGRIQTKLRLTLPLLCAADFKEYKNYSSNQLKSEIL